MSSQAVALIEKPRGRGRLPMPYDADIAEDICIQIATSSKGLATILREQPRFPSLTVVANWLNSNNDFKELYARSKEFQVEMMGEDIIDIIDSDKLEAHDKRIRVDGRKWLMAKLKPRKYGDSIDITSGNEPLKPSSPIDVSVRLTAIMLAASRRRSAEDLLED